MYGHKLQPLSVNLQFPRRIYVCSEKHAGDMAGRQVRAQGRRHKHRHRYRGVGQVGGRGLSDPLISVEVRVMLWLAPELKRSGGGGLNDPLIPVEVRV